MEAALRRTTEVHRTQLKQRDLELNELQRIIAAKERSLDSLRETIATTKRTYENKLSQVEAALAMRDGEVRRRVLATREPVPPPPAVLALSLQQR